MLQVPGYGYITFVALFVAIRQVVSGYPNAKLIELLLFVSVIEFLVAPTVAAQYANNQALYTVYTPLLTSFYIYLISYPTDRYRRMWIAVPLLVLAVDLLVNPRVEGLRLYPYLTGLLVSVFLFVSRVRKTIVQESVADLLRQYQFYLGLGITLFFLVMFPILWCIDLFINEDSSDLYSNLLQTANILLALGYLGAALCPILTQRSTE